MGCPARYDKDKGKKTGHYEPDCCVLRAPRDQVVPPLRFWMPEDEVLPVDGWPSDDDILFNVFPPVRTHDDRETLPPHSPEPL